MQVSRVRNGCLAVLFLLIPLIHCSSEVLQGRDYNDDSREFHRIQLLLQNIRSFIGVPLSYFDSAQKESIFYVKIKPQDLVILPPDYLISNGNDETSMMELHEDRLLVICQDLSVDSPYEWPMMRLCPGQENLLKEFLAALRSHGSRIGISRGRLDEATSLEASKINEFHCRPKDPSKTCYQPSPSHSNTETSTWLNLSDYLKSIYTPSVYSTVKLIASDVFVTDRTSWTKTTVSVSTAQTITSYVFVTDKQAWNVKTMPILPSHTSASTTRVSSSPVSITSKSSITMASSVSSYFHSYSTNMTSSAAVTAGHTSWPLFSTLELPALATQQSSSEMQSSASSMSLAPPLPTVGSFVSPLLPRPFTSLPSRSHSPDTASFTSGSSLTPPSSSTNRVSPEHPIIASIPSKGHRY